MSVQRNATTGESHDPAHEQWIVALRTGWLSTQIASSASLEAEKFGDELEKTLTNGCMPGVANRAWLQRLPLSVIRQIAAIFDGQKIKALPKCVREVPKEASTLLLDATFLQREAAAQVLAHHIIHGSASPFRISRLGKSELGKNKDAREWQSLYDDATLRDSFKNVAATLRDPKKTTAERLKAVDQLASLIGPQRGQAGMPWWEQIDFALRSRLFAWPLLVMGNPWVGLSLPVEIDLLTAETPPKQGDAAIRVDDPQFKFDEQFTQALTAAVNAAKTLWFDSNCCDFGGSRTVSVERTRVKFSFTTAGKMLQPMLGRDTFEVSGPSAGPYFAVAVLARLLGRQWTIDTAVTGKLHKPVMRLFDAYFPERTAGTVVDYQLEPVQGLSAKAEFAKKCGLFNRVHIVNAPVGDHYETLSGVADELLLQPWRRDGFVRCPEVEWAALKAPDGRADASKVAEVRRRIGQEKVVELPAGHSPLAVAEALRNPSRTLRRPRVLFVRVDENETNIRAWQTIAAACGAPEALLERIRRATVETAPAAVAALLNAPSPQHPGHAPPDVLVLIDSHLLDRQVKYNPAPSSRPIAPATVFAEIEALLQVDPVLTTASQTRIILVPGDDSKRDAVPPNEAWPDGYFFPNGLDLKALRDLAVFRYGFSCAAARGLLKRRSELVRELQQFDVETTWNKFFKRNIASGVGTLRQTSGGYLHMPAKLRTALLGYREPWADDKKQRWFCGSRHLAAALALAPFADPKGQTFGLPMDEALAPANITEAVHHLETAYRAFQANGAANPSNEATSPLRHLQRFANINDWRTVRSLRQQNHAADAAAIARELIEEQEQAGEIPHALSYIHYAMALAEMIEASDQPGTIATKFVDAVAAIVKARAACLTALEQKYCTMRLNSEVSNRAYEILQFKDADPLTLAAAGTLLNDTDDYVEKNRSADKDSRPEGDWFERKGNCEADHARAFGYYLFGTRDADRWGQNWVLAVGAAALAGVAITLDGAAPPNQLCATLLAEGNALRALQELVDGTSNLPSKQIKVAFTRLESRCDRDLLPSYVNDRWRKAKAILDP